MFKRLKAFRSKLAQQINNQSGQGATEYILLLVVVVTVVLALKKPLLDKMNQAMDNLGLKIDEVNGP